MKEGCCCSCHEKIGPKEKNWDDTIKEAKAEAKKIIDNLTFDQRAALADLDLLELYYKRK